jgi:hypothetical protein
MNGSNLGLLLVPRNHAGRGRCATVPLSEKRIGVRARWAAGILAGARFSIGRSNPIAPRACPNAGWQDQEARCLTPERTGSYSDDVIYDI